MPDLIPDSLPPHAKRVFTSDVTRTEVWQWEQERFDGSVKTYEKIRRPDTVEVIATVGDKIIVEEQEQPGWGHTVLSVPGGQVDGAYEETSTSDRLLAEVQREFLEETGYASEDWEHWFSVTPSGRHIYSVHWYLARNCRYVQLPNPGPGEKISVRLVPFDEFLLLSERPDFRGVDLVNRLLHMRLHPEEREAFCCRLFKNRTVHTPVLY